jgi:hypothetical protein
MRARFSLVVVTVAIGAAAIAAWLFPRALPILSLEQRLTREQALARADSFFALHQLAPANARTAVLFDRNDSLRTFIELAGGGGDSLNALVRGRDATVFVWSVRAFAPGNVRETRVDFAPDGRVIGFERTLAETDVRPALAADSARRIAEQVLGMWVAPRAGNWQLVGSSYQTRKTSNRVDHTFTFERTDRRIAGAPIRIETVIAGDTPAKVRPFVEVPQSFLQRYGEMRSWNELLSLLASIGVLAVAIIGMVGLARFARAGAVRWKPAMVVGGVIGALALAAGLNEIPGGWFHYDTAVSPTTFRVTAIVGAFLFGVTTGLFTGFTLAAAEAATRHAFPRHLDWWKLWRHRGTREVAGAVGGGYAVAAIAFAYVAVFYFTTRTLFGWWTPSELLDDPNQIASPMPWISGLAMSLNAGVWEEALFRALPLSLLSLWIGDRPHRRWWMVAGVVVTALVFGFAHANYESWPPYSRGVEIFLDACFWAFLFLRFGLLVTVLAHFVYDAVLFGIFAAQGSAPEYRITAAILLAALLAPAAIVLWRRVRHGAFIAAPEDARFASWTPTQRSAPDTVARVREPAGLFSRRAQRLAIAAGVAGLVVAVARPEDPTLGPPFTAPRSQVIQTADSMLREAGTDPASWKRLTEIGNDTVAGWRRFLRKHDIEREAQTYAGTYAIPAWWIARYVKTTGTANDRIEEWRVRVLPDGSPLDVRHLVPDSLRRDTADAAETRRIARAALARAGIDTLVLRESDVTETPRPARRDVTVRYADTSVRLPEGAVARAYVQIAGNDPLVARRGIELPESFLRAERERQTNRLAIFGILVLLFVGALIGGALYARKRRPILVDDGHLDRRTSILFLVGLFLLAVLGRLNRAYSELYAYDTSEPWSNFVSTVALGVVGDLIFAFVLFGLWLGANGLRRRVGIPMFGDGTQGEREAVIAGVGIAGVGALLSAAIAVTARAGIPGTPDTSLDLVVPWLAGVESVPADAIQSAIVPAIPLLVIAALTPSWRRRALIAVATAAIAGGAMWAVAGDAGVRPLGAAVSLLSAGIMMAALIGWGTRSAWSWYVASLAFTVIAGMRAVIWAPVWQERVAAGLVMLVAIALIVAIVRWGRTLEARDEAPDVFAANPVLQPTP